MLASRLLYFNPTVKFDLIRLRDAVDWWVTYNITDRCVIA
jgi:hypothetical protein